MKKEFLLILITVAGLVANSQSRNYLELAPYVRFDKYPAFDYSINAQTTNTVKITGTSWGAGLWYHFRSDHAVHFKAGIGYDRYSFNTIKGENSSFGQISQRTINYVGNGDVIYATNKYWYHTLTASIGVEQLIPLQKNVTFNWGLSLKNYYTFAQYYRITHDFPTGPPRHRFVRHAKRNFAFSGLLEASVLKELHKFSVGPFLQVPVYDQWQQDALFPQENDTDSRSKWLRGIAGGISLRLAF